LSKDFSMKHERFRLKAQTLGIDSGIAVLIPQNATITVADDCLDDKRMTDVIWHGRPIRIFVEDLRARGQSLGPCDSQEDALAATVR
jgi:hypothetical protein